MVVCRALSREENLEPYNCIFDSLPCIYNIFVRLVWFIMTMKPLVISPQGNQLIAIVLGILYS